MRKNHMGTTIDGFLKVEGIFEGQQYTGEVEADETFIGGNARNMHAGKRARRVTGPGRKDQMVVMGILYLDEEAYRYNRRKMTDGERFNAAVTGIVGKRLALDGLTGKMDVRA